MLPAKIELTVDVATKLRDIRLTNPVDGKVLSAEALSLAIGNSNAWMSQIERRRLKKIKREDIIKIFKVLFQEPDSDKAEEIAEAELKKYYSTTDTNKTSESEIDTTTKQFFDMELRYFNQDIQEMFDTGDSTTKLQLLRKLSFCSYCLYASFESVDFCYDHFFPFGNIQYADPMKKQEIADRLRAMDDELIPYKIKSLNRKLEDELSYLTQLSQEQLKTRIKRDTLGDYVSNIYFLFKNNIDTSALAEYINSFKKILFTFFGDDDTIDNLNSYSTSKDCEKVMKQLIEIFNAKKEW